MTASIFDPMIQIKYVNTTHRLADILTKASFTRDRWTQLTLLVNIMTHTTLTKSNLSISSAVVNPSFSSMSKRARDCFRNIGKRESKASSLHSDVCVKISEKNANVVCHAVLPPEYQAGGDSKREDLCWPDSERSNEHNARSIKLPASGGSSSGRPVATEDPSREKKVRLHSNTAGEQYIKKFNEVANTFKPQSEEEH